MRPRTRVVPVARPGTAPRSFGILSSFPPTACGIATFSAALAAGLLANGATVDIVRCGGAAPTMEDPLVLASLGDGAGRVRRRHRGARPADVAIVQHEYGIYGGHDGDDVLAVLEGSRCRRSSSPTRCSATRRPTSATSWNGSAPPPTPSS